MTDKAKTASTTRVCSKCGREFKVDSPKSRRKVCNGCKAGSRRRNGGGGGRRALSAAAYVLARSAPPGGHGGNGETGGGAISVNAGYYRDRQPGDGMPPVVVLTGDDEGELVALNGKKAKPGLTLNQMAGHLTERYGYVLTGRNGQEVTLAREVPRC
jgi:hypothetical protein